MQVRGERRLQRMSGIGARRGLRRGHVFGVRRQQIEFVDEKTLQTITKLAKELHSLFEPRHTVVATRQL